MASTGIHGHGTTLAGSTLSTVAEVTNIDISGYECDDIDLGSMDSTNKHRDFISGMINAGEISFTCVYTKAEASSLFGAIGTSDTFTVTFPDASTFVATGYVKSAGIAIPFEDKLEQTGSIKLSGEPTFTAGT